MKFIDLLLKRISSVYPLQVYFGQKKNVQAWPQKYNISYKAHTNLIRLFLYIYNNK